MKAKIGNRLFDSRNEPIMIVLSDSDKENISNMPNDKTKYCSYPKGMNAEDIIDFME